jgi:hypothetical protein
MQALHLLAAVLAMIACSSAEFNFLIIGDWGGAAIPGDKVNVDAVGSAVMRIRDRALV